MFEYYFSMKVVETQNRKLKNSVFKLKKLEDHKWANLSHYNYLMRFTHFVNDDEHTEPIYLEFFREINFTNFYREIDYFAF